MESYHQTPGCNPITACLTLIFPVLRRRGRQDQRRLPGPTQPAGGREGEAGGRPAQPAGRGGDHPHHEAHLGPSHQVRDHCTGGGDMVVRDDKIKSPNWPRL